MFLRIVVKFKIPPHKMLARKASFASQYPSSSGPVALRQDCAAEEIEDGGWCNSEGKGRGGARRVHEDASYAQLRARLGL